MVRGSLATMDLFNRVSKVTPGGGADTMNIAALFSESESRSNPRLIVASKS